MRRNAALAIALLALAAATAGCGSAAAAPEPAARPAFIVIIDADQYGAIVMDGGRREYSGVRRDGTVVWRSPQEATAPDAVACLARCPEALLSGNPLARDSAAAPDPEPVLVVNGHRTPAGAAALHGRTKRRVLSAVSADDFLVATGTGNDWWFEAHRPGAAPTRWKASGFRTSWQQTRDGRLGIAIVGSDDPARGNAQWFTRAAGGWRPEGAPVAVPGSSACLAADGSRAMILGAKPAVLDRSGRSQPIGDLGFTSDCAFAAVGGIIGEYGQDNSGMTVHLQAFGRDAAPVWQANLPGTARVTADPLSASAAYASKGTTTELDLVSGRILRTIKNAHAAAYDGAGSLVVADGQGVPRWLRSRGGKLPVSAGR